LKKIIVLKNKKKVKEMGVLVKNASQSVGMEAQRLFDSFWSFSSAGQLGDYFHLYKSLPFPSVFFFLLVEKSILVFVLKHLARDKHHNS
jgi:hypothetical protein